MHQQPTEKQIRDTYNLAKERYATVGVDADAALELARRLGLAERPAGGVELLVVGDDHQNSSRFRSSARLPRVVLRPSLVVEDVDVVCSLR